MIKHLVFDIDGTLIDSYHGIDKIEPCLYQTLLELKDAGHRLYIATGRSKALLPTELRTFPFDGYFLTNGAYVEIDKKIVRNTIFSNEDLKVIHDFSTKNNGLYYFLTGDTMYTSDALHPVHSMVRKVWPIPNILEDHFNIDEVKCNQIMYLSDDLNDQSKIKGIVNNEYDYVFHEGYKSFDILIQNINKGAILKDYFDDQGISARDIIVFGDGHNDIEMFDIADIRVAMGNACEPLKNKATIVTRSVDQQGVLFALKQLNLVKQ